MTDCCCRVGYQNYENLPPFPPVVPQYAQTVTVALSGGDFTSIKDAVDSIVDAAAIKPYLVRVFPGVYAEDPIVMQPFVDVMGVGGPADVLVDANTATAALFTGSAGTMLGRMTLRGASGVGGFGFRSASAGNPAFLFDVSVVNCTTGFAAVGPGVAVIGNQLGVTTTVGVTTDDAVLASTGAAFIGQDCGIQNVGGTLTNGVRADATSRVTWRSCNVLAAATGVFADGGEVVVQSGECNTCADAFTCTDGTLRLSSVTITATTAFDIRATTADSAVLVNGANYAQNQLDIAAGATFVGNILHDADPSSSIDSAMRIIGELSVGLFDLPAESVFGGGDSHTTGMVVKSNTNGEIGAWVDNTAAAASQAGSTFALLQGIGIGQTAYFGGDQPFPGLKTDTTAAIVLGGTGVLVWEYWSGAAWTAFFVMATDSSAPFSAYAQAVFERIQSDQIRFADLPGWATKLLDGDTKFWTRVRVTAAITTVPTLESVKLHTDRSEINADGFVEFFGAARALKNIPADFFDISGAAPGNANLNISANIVLVQTGNQFNNNALDSRGAIIEIPDGLDTSLGLVLGIDWYSPATGGNVELEVDFTEVAIGDVINGTLPETRVSTIEAAPGVVNTLVRTLFDVSVEGLVPGEHLAVRFFRDATGGNLDDTLVGNIIIFDVTVQGNVWHA
jgi:hypothetical protein